MTKCKALIAIEGSTSEVEVIHKRDPDFILDDLQSALSDAAVRFRKVAGERELTSKDILNIHLVTKTIKDMMEIRMKLSKDELNKPLSQEEEKEALREVIENEMTTDELAQIVLQMQERERGGEK